MQRKSPHTALRTAATVRKRLSPLGHDFLKDILNLPERSYIQLLMVALLVQSPIIADFMRNVFASNNPKSSVRPPVLLKTSKK